MRLSVSIKGVIFPEPGKCAVALNDRNEWELPGGRIEPGETPEECLVREISEELGVVVEVVQPLDSYIFEVIPGAHVFIVTYGCILCGTYAPRISTEHSEIALFPVADLPSNLPLGYRKSIESWSTAPEHRRQWR